MSEILILKSINGRILTEKLIDSWFDTNEIFIRKKIFSDDRYSIEITFIDEERADMMSDLLNTCYGSFISIGRPEIAMQSLDNSIDEERTPSPVHLSSACSVSSKVSCFSRRLIALDGKQNDEKIKLAVGRGRSINTSVPQMNVSIGKEINDEEDSLNTNSNATSPTDSIMDNTSSIGRGRGSVFQ